jgi:hypothetical protein
LRRLFVDKKKRLSRRLVRVLVHPVILAARAAA